MCVSGGEAVCHQQCFPFLSLSSPQNSSWEFKISELSSFLLRFQLWSLFLWLLIFILDPFEKFQFVFNFIFQSQFVILFVALSSPQNSCWEFKISELSSSLLRFQLWSLFIWLLIFVLDPFEKFQFVFNFKFQSQFVICYFSQFDPSFFNCFFLFFC